MENKQFTLEDQSLLEELLLHRRDVRGNNFLSDPISDEIIDKLLQAASMAPSVGFSQPWEFVLIRDAEIKQQVADNFAAENKKAANAFSDDKQQRYQQLKLEGILEAPLNIAVFYKPSVKPVLGQNSMLEAGEYSVVCAIQNIWLMARAMNIGLGWVSILNPEEIKQILNAPTENKLVAYLCLGYVKTFYDRPELEKKRWEKRKTIRSVVYSEGYP
ncbi:5,6-dimethylbenzimidazole synthase [Aestuariirhabdus sp. Z084]|uniref:5,6-dimethylbenzimidazole synthase n=1 Tax=Aestuariirhabdus haliotis TaxID=2918751 RepID=UPI00201B38E4|nr:5,6-dimethylbenzimidazole synthase [Aestuariirhabdus haliotis]MCL6417593.1 5,6-dimethylbenzimidazole synthase [Aestuariirhabdus haliotis]MCL6421503.1 5,6-dimethylbenzimidazole synthase [Aestuariirhabdus haliotis]